LQSFLVTRHGLPVVSWADRPDPLLQARLVQPGAPAPSLS